MASTDLNILHMIHPDIINFNREMQETDKAVCDLLASIISQNLPDAEQKIWHKHPVWFLDNNPIVGYSKLKAGIRLMFWSGASFGEPLLKPGTGKFKDASILYSSVDEVDEKDLSRWLSQSRKIQWDYANIYKRKGELLRLC